MKHIRNSVCRNARNSAKFHSQNAQEFCGILCIAPKNSIFHRKPKNHFRRHPSFQPKRLLDKKVAPLQGGREKAKASRPTGGTNHQSVVLCVCVSAARRQRVEIWELGISTSQFTLKKCVVLQVNDAAVRIRLVVFVSKVQRFYIQITELTGKGRGRGEGCHPSELLCWLTVIWSGAPTDSLGGGPQHYNWRRVYINQHPLKQEVQIRPVLCPYFLFSFRLRNTLM